MAVKLVDPTDWDILDEMSEGQRETAPNLAEKLGRQRQYMNDRLSHLAGIGLVKRVGPAERSGMYVITSLGEEALKHQDAYEHVDSNYFSKLVEAADEFSTLVEVAEEAESNSKDAEEAESSSKYEIILSSLADRDVESLDELADLTGLSRNELQTILQSLELRELVDRIDEEKYEVTDIGKTVLQSDREYSSESGKAT